MSYFLKTVVNIVGNKKLRNPQIEAYLKTKVFFENNPAGEALVVLPTGTGKSGLISIAPYSICKKRVLIITPGIVTKKSVVKTLHPLEDNFWLKYDVLFDPEDLPVVEEYEPDMLFSSLEKCNFVIANVHKLYESNPKSLLNVVGQDFFDMVIIDEAHHSVANTWQTALNYFKDAKKLHVTGTPYRGDNIEIPGELIHSTSLSEVMTLKLVKWLRKATVNSCNMYFTIPGDSTKYSKEQVLMLKDKEWLEKSVALSKDCSMDVIDESIKNLDLLRELSPNVPHKILAVACSISHANQVAKWYWDRNKTAVVVHSKMEPSELDESFKRIESNECDVVVSVNMLMEGYDHKYLSVLAIFRPYRSKNAFAQVVGRVLRAIPDEEITDFAIDNNACVIYHEETGLDTMWRDFSDEVEKSKKHSPKEYEFSDKEYSERETLYANIEADEHYVTPPDSYLADIDFNELFETARKNIDKLVNDKIMKFKEAGIDENEIEQYKEFLQKKETASKKNEIDSLLISKRPELARKTIKNILYKNANDAAQAILEEKQIDPKVCTLYNKFRNLVNIRANTPNDGVLVWYINDRLFRRYGPVNQRSPEILLLSQKYMAEIVSELRRML